MSSKEADIKDDQQNTRKSKRQRKPNVFYIGGATENAYETVKQKKINKRYNQQSISYTQEKNHEDQYESMQNEDEKSEDWYPCVIPNKPLMKLEIIIKGPERQREKKKEECKQKIKPSTDLLSIFQKAIQDVTEIPAQKTKIKPSASLESKTFQQGRKDLQFPYKLPPKKNRNIENEKINNACLNAKVLTLQHNQQGQLKYDMDWEHHEIMLNENDQTTISIYKEKIDSIRGNYCSLLQRIYQS